MITNQFSDLYHEVSKNQAPKQGAPIDVGKGAPKGLSTEQHAIREADSQASAGFVAPGAGTSRPPHTKEQP